MYIHFVLYSVLSHVKFVFYKYIWFMSVNSILYIMIYNFTFHLIRKLFLSIYWCLWGRIIQRIWHFKIIKTDSLFFFKHFFIGIYCISFALMLETLMFDKLVSNISYWLWYHITIFKFWWICLCTNIYQIKNVPFNLCNFEIQCNMFPRNIGSAPPVCLSV